MIYSLSLLTTCAQCDAVLAAAAARKKVLTLRDTETEFYTDNTTTAAKNLSNELKGLNAYIVAMTPVLDTLEPGKPYDDAANELRVKTDRRDQLLARQRKEGAEKVLLSELAQALLEPQPPLVDEFISQVTAHRATLSE